MNRDEKIKNLQDFDEKQLRERVAVPLLIKMGFIDPIIHHHSNEKGKDIVCKEIDDKFKKIKYLSVIVKCGDVTGASQGVNSYFNIINQVKQSFNEPYKHIYDLKEIDINECIIITSGKFLPTALESIFGTLKADRLDKFIREPIDINKLIKLIDDYFPEFWKEFTNQEKEVIEQRNHLSNNTAKLIKLIVRNGKDQEKALRLAATSDLDFATFPFNEISKYIADVGYHKIQIDEIDEYYAEDIDNYYCDIKEHIFDFKKYIQGILYKMDEVIEIMKMILKEKNPKKIVELCEDLLGYINYHGDLCFSASDVRGQGDFSSALDEYREKKERLVENKMLDFYKALSYDVQVKVKNALIEFWKKHPRDEKDIWLGYSLKFSFRERKIIESTVYEYKEEPKLKEQDQNAGKYELEKVIVENERIKIELAVNYYGIFNEDKLSIEKRAEEFIWHFRKPLLEKIIELLPKKVK